MTESDSQSIALKSNANAATVTDLSQMANLVLSLKLSKGDSVKQPELQLKACEQLLKQNASARESVLQFIRSYLPDATGLSAAAPILQLQPDQLMWLKFKEIIRSNATVNTRVNEYVDSVRCGKNVLFPRDEDEDVIMESLFADHAYLLKTKSFDEVADGLEDLCDLRLKHAQQINEFQQTAASDDYLVIDVSNQPKVEVRKELRDLAARKLHIVTKDLMEELYEYYRLEALTGARATTGISHELRM